MKNINKEYFPNKIYLVCKRPFSWRKELTKDWDNVKYCGERCRKNKNRQI